MTPRFETISTADQWVNGQTYRLAYAVDHVKLFGMTLPDYLIPDSVKEGLAKKQISQLVEKLSSDPRMEVLGYEYHGETFTVDVIARDNPFPVAVVVVGIIALAVIFGIALTTREVQKLIVSADELAKTVGPIGTTLGIGTIAAVVGVGAFFLLKARA